MSYIVFVDILHTFNLLCALGSCHMVKFFYLFICETGRLLVSKYV